MGPLAIRSAVAGAALGSASMALVWGVAWAERGLPALVQLPRDEPLVVLAAIAPIAWALFGAWIGHTADARVHATTPALRRQDARLQELATYHAALTRLPEGVLLEQDGQIVYANDAAARILGVDPATLEGPSLHDLLGEPDVDPESVVRATAAGEVLGAAQRRPARDALGRWFVAEVGSLELELGLVVHLLRDVSDHERAEATQRGIHQVIAEARDQVAARDEARRRFLIGLAHELRTPLASMRGYLELIDEEAHVHAAPEDLARVRAAGEQVLEVVARVHDQAMLEPGPGSDRLGLYLVPVVVGELLDDVAAAIRPLLPPEVALHVEIEAGTGHVHADRHRLRQILLTLLSRASLSVREGEIRLTGRRGPTADRVSLEVLDTGPEIPVSELRTVFSPHPGAFPGLAAAHELARHMAGELVVEGPGTPGTTFRLTLPAAARDEKVERWVRTRLPPGDGQVVLLVDDARVRGMLEAALGSRGLRVASGASAAAAGAVAVAIPPDRVIVDLGLVRRDPWAELARLAPQLPLVPLLGLAVEGNNAVLLAIEAVIPRSADDDHLQTIVAEIADPGRPIVAFGAAVGTLEGARRGSPVVAAPDRASAERVLASAGLLVVALLADGAAGLAFALDHSEHVPTLALVPAAPDREACAAARRVLRHHLRSEGAPLAEVVDRLIQRVGAAARRQVIPVSSM